MARASVTDQVRIELLERHSELERRAEAFRAAEIARSEDDESDAFARRVVAGLGGAGLLDAAVDLDIRGVCLLREVVAWSSGLADSMLALQGLGYAPIALAGTEAQRARWRDPVRRGEAIAAIAITEPEAGSDVGAIRTEARAVDGGFVLSGRKCFITNAGLADVYVVFARTSPDGARGLSAFIVPGPLVRLVERYEVIAPHPLGEVAFDEVRLPPEGLLGPLGGGFKLAMATLDRFRPTVGAAALGMASRALEEAVGRARARRQFGQPIGAFQQVQALIADSYAELLAARLLVYRAASARDLGEPEAEAARLASAAKLVATETAQRVIDRALQVHGGQGVRRGTPVERLYREVRALRIYEGTSEIQRLVLGRSLTGPLS
jgi:acyl-CoA dehydrogenase